MSLLPLKRKKDKVESYTPEELDIPFPEIRRINIGWCPGTGTHWSEVSMIKSHTHMCAKDEFYRNICIPDITYIFNSDKSLSDLMWHEYAHILDSKNVGPYVVNCNVNGYHSFEFPSNEEVKVLDLQGHGPSWKKIMERFGKKATLMVPKPY